MPVQCEDFSHLLMSITSSLDMDKVAVFKGTITSINRTENTANVTYTTFPLVPANYPSLISSDVPFFYHCEFSNGTEEDLAFGNKAFQEDDDVYVLHYWGLALEETGNTYIVGHADIEDIKKCGGDVLKIVMKRIGATGNPVANEEYVTIFDVDLGAVVEDVEITFPCPVDTAFNIWYGEHFFDEVSDDIRNNFVTRFESGFGDTVIDRSGTFWMDYALGSHSCVDEPSNNAYCIYEPTGEVSSNEVAEEGYGHHIKEKTFSHYYVPDLDTSHEQSEIDYQGYFIQAPMYIYNVKVWSGVDCADEPLSLGSTWWPLTISRSTDHEGVEQSITVHGYFMDGGLKHYFYTLNNKYFAAHRATMRLEKRRYLAHYLDQAVSPDPNPTCVRPTLINNNESYTSRTKNAHLYSVYLPWDPDAVTPFFDIEICASQINGTSIGPDDTDYYNDRESGEHTMIRNGDVPLINYYDNSFQPSIADAPLLINSSDIVVGANGTYGIACICSFQNVLSEVYEGTGWKGDVFQYPDNLVSSSYSYDDRQKAIECVINDDTVVIDPDTGDVVMNLADFQRTLTAIEMEGALDALLELMIATEYPTGQITKQECDDAIGSYWQITAELCTYK